MIESVECLETELQPHPLSDLSVLKQTQVQLIGDRTTFRVSRGVAVRRMEVESCRARAVDNILDLAQGYLGDNAPVQVIYQVDRRWVRIKSRYRPEEHERILVVHTNHTRIRI